LYKLNSFQFWLNYFSLAVSLVSSSCACFAFDRCDSGEFPGSTCVTTGSGELEQPEIGRDNDSVVSSKTIFDLMTDFI